MESGKERRIYIMEYQLFTLPNCYKCKEVKDYLKKKGISYEEINAGVSKGKSQFNKFYVENKEKIKREESGTISFPILVHDENIFQGLEKILNLELK
jgi:glutaredoxin